MRRILAFWTLVAVVAGLAITVYADVPTSMNVQGRLTDAAGIPLKAGPKAFTFKVFNAAAGGKEVWPGGTGEFQTIATDASGLWTAHLGSDIPLPPEIFEDTSLWLQITVEDSPNPPEVFPLVKLNTGPFAFRAASSQTADIAQSLAGGTAFLPLAGGTMTGPITNTNEPPITMGKGNFGSDNINPGDWAFVAGENNEATGDHSTVGGGYYHYAEGNYTVIGGGLSSFARGNYSAVLGGLGNDAAGAMSTIGGGASNLAADSCAFVGGGRHNNAHGRYSVIGGGGGDMVTDSNSAKGYYSVVGGGRRNSAPVKGGTVSGGSDNLLGAPYAVISGGEDNYSGGYHDVIGGGHLNETADNYSTIGGGTENRAINYGSTVGGGVTNAATGIQTVVCGGGSNTASGSYSAIGGGIFNFARGLISVVAGGENNRARGAFSVVGGGGGGGPDDLDGDSNVAVGECAVVPGGRSNYAGGHFSFAAGLHARAAHDGAFVWADSTDAEFASTRKNQFLVRASGGVGLGTNDPGTGTALRVTDESIGPFVEMIKFNALTAPTAQDDILSIEAPTGSPDDFQFVECERTGDIEIRLHGNGNITADGTITGGGADLAEMVAVSSGAMSVAPGDVMVIDPRNPRALTRSSAPRSTLVAGIYSTTPGFLASPHDWDQVAIERGLATKSADNDETSIPSIGDIASAIGEIPLAVVGIVPCRVSAENGAINPGDLLVTAATAGHAMRDDNPKAGTILGKALGRLASGTGTIDVLVTLQ